MSSSLPPPRHLQAPMPLVEPPIIESKNPHYDTIMKEERTESEDGDRPPPSATLTEEQLSEMSGAELIDLCKKRNLAIRGTNADKIERLLLGKKRRKVPSDQERKANQRERTAKSRARKKEAESLQRQKDEEESNKNLTQFSK